MKRICAPARLFSAILAALDRRLTRRRVECRGRGADRAARLHADGQRARRRPSTRLRRSRGSPRSAQSATSCRSRRARPSRTTASCSTASRTSRRSPRRSLTLPWITGNPHSLYARVRAILAGGGTSPWSADYGFDVVPPAPPTSISSYNGLLRWSPVQGATGYEVWLLDAAKIERRQHERSRRARVLRLAVVERIRALARACRCGSNVVGRINGMPVTHARRVEPDLYGARHSLPADAPIQLVGTVSESFSDGSMASSAHKLMPAFVWTGNEDPLDRNAGLPLPRRSVHRQQLSQQGLDGCRGHVAGLRAALVRSRHRRRTELHAGRRSS